MHRDITNDKNHLRHAQPAANASVNAPLNPPTGGDPDEYNRSVNAQHLTDDPADPEWKDLRALLENSH